MRVCVYVTRLGARVRGQDMVFIHTKPLQLIRSAGHCSSVNFQTCLNLSSSSMKATMMASDLVIACLTLSALSSLNICFSMESTREPRSSAWEGERGKKGGEGGREGGKEGKEEREEGTLSQARLLK